MAKVVGFQVKIEGTDSQLKALGELRDSTIRLGEARKQLEKTAKTTQGLTAAQTKELGRLTAAQKATSKTTAELNKEIARSAKAADTAAGSYDSLTQENAELTAQIRKIGDPLGKNAKQFQTLTKRVKDNTVKLTSFDKAMGRSQRNVGNYSASIKEGVTNSGLFSRELSIISRVSGTLAPAFGKATKGITGMAKGMRILKIALISSGIGAIVVALGSLIAAFAGTQRGADAFTKVLRPLQALFSKFVGFLENTAFKAFDQLKAAFADPKQAVIDLADAIKNNLIKRFEGIAVFGKGIAKLFRGEFSEGFETLGNAAVQMSTGIEDASGKLRALSDEVGDFVDEAIMQGEQLDALLKRFEKRQIASVLPLAQARLEFQKMRAIANDLTKTDEQRLEALKKAEQQQRFIVATERELLNLRIAAMELEQSFNDTSREEQLELVRLKEESVNFEAAAQKKINSLIALGSGIRKRQFAAIKKANDEFTKELERREKSIAKTRIEFNKRTLETISKEEHDALEVRRKASEKQDKEDFERRKANAEALKSFAVDIAQSTSDSLFEQRAQSFEREQERRSEELEIEKNLELTAVQDKAAAENEILSSKLKNGLITEKQFADQKAIADANKRKQEEVVQLKALARQRAIDKDAFKKKKSLDIKQAIINGALAVTQILAQTGVAAAIPIALAVATTAANVATIASQKFAKGGVVEGASHSNGGVDFNGGKYELEGGEAVINKNSTAMFGGLLSHLNELGGGKSFALAGGRTFQSGGVIPSPSLPAAFNITGITEQVAASIRVENVATETAEVNRSVVDVENIASA